MITCLTDAYAGFMTYVQQHDSLPTSAYAKSRLELEETTMLQRAPRESSSSDTTTLLVKTASDEIVIPLAPTCQNRDNRGKRNHHNSVGRNTSRGGRNWPNHFGGGGHRQQQQQWRQWGPWQQRAPWNIPPCPYPTYNLRMPNNTTNPYQDGVLGPRLQQVVFHVNTPSPTDIENVLRTLNLAQPGPSWYNDIGATSYMTSLQSNLSSYFKFSKNNKIIVENGQSIPIYGAGSTQIAPTLLLS